ncbi:MAG: hypothetical protein M0Z59_02860 [Nitrospiraceae bacterium]|nr:hypothetical protein [Nitrospiraceae bacterium]
MPEAFERKIERCIAIEMACAELYRLLGGVFPQTAELCKALSMDEENHALLLIVGRGLYREGRTHGGLTPESVPSFEGLLEELREFRRRLGQEDIPLEEALETALSVEKSMMEGYESAALVEEHSPFRKLFSGEQSHAKRIAALMKGMGGFSSGKKPAESSMQHWR